MVNWKIIICKECGITKKTNNKQYCSTQCAKIHVSKQKYQAYMSNQEAVCGKKISIQSLKPFILEEQHHTCTICSIKDEWNGKPLIFVCDHIDGDNTNNLRSNLRLICSNCNSQLDTFAGRNIKTKLKKDPNLYKQSYIRKLSDQDVLDIVERYDNGETQRFIAKSYNVTQAAIQHRIRMFKSS